MAQQAVSLALERREQIVFMDIKMPLLNGIDAARQIEAGWRVSPIPAQPGDLGFRDNGYQCATDVVRYCGESKRVTLRAADGLGGGRTASRGLPRRSRCFMNTG